MNNTTVKAKEKSYESEREYAISYLELNGFSINSISDPIELYNLNLELEAVCFTLNKKGYIIVNVKDLDIPEFSFEASNPFVNGDYRYLYNGPTEYYYSDYKGKVFEARTNQEINKSELLLKYDKNTINKMEKYNNLNNYKQTRLNSIVSSFVESGNIPYSLSTWSSSYYCGLDGCAIVLKYYDLHYSDSWLPSNYTTNGNVQDYLLSNLYIKNTGTVGYYLVLGDGQFTGLRDYLNDQNITSYEAYYQAYSLGYIHSLIDMGYPVITGILDNPTYGDHWVITHGYLTGYDGVAYLIVNDGWGSNNIYIAGSYCDEMVYIN